MGTSSLKYWGVLNTIRRPPEMVWRGLRSFLRQNHKPEKIFFVDQNDTPMVLPEDLKKCDFFIHHHEPVPSVGLARNLIPKDLTTDWIIFCDDDGFLADDYTDKLCEEIQTDPNLELIAGPYINETDGNFYSSRHIIGGRLDTIWGTKLLLGSNFAIKPNTFNRIGRYDARFGPGSSFPSSDETDLCWRAYTNKVPMKYSAQIRVFHPPPHSDNIEIAQKKAFQYGRGKGALTAKWMIERPSLLGFYEFIEMNLIPISKIIIGLFTARATLITIQYSVLRGRWQGFYQFIRGMNKK